MKRTRKQKNKVYVPKKKGQYKTLETDVSEMEISDLPDKDVKIMAVKIFNKENNA